MASAFARAVSPPDSRGASFGKELASRERFGRGTGLGGINLSKLTPSNATQYATTGGGAVSGAVLGTVIFPGVGTIIGAGIGALGGLLAGSAFSKTVSGHQEREAELAPALASQAALVSSLQGQIQSLAGLLQQVEDVPIGVANPPDGGAGLIAIQQKISQVGPQVQAIQAAVGAMDPSKVYQESDPAAPSNAAPGLQNLMASLSGQLRQAQAQIWSWQEGQIAIQHTAAAAAIAPASVWTADHQVNGTWVDAQGMSWAQAEAA